MNTDTIEANLHKMSGKIKEEWGKLTDDDLSKVDGKLEQLVGVIQEKYGLARDEAKAQVEKFCSSCH